MALLAHFARKRSKTLSAAIKCKQHKTPAIKHCPASIKSKNNSNQCPLASASGQQAMSPLQNRQR
jgi:hypothetical protein